MKVSKIYANSEVVARVRAASEKSADSPIDRPFIRVSGENHRAERQTSNEDMPPTRRTIEKQRHYFGAENRLIAEHYRHSCGMMLLPPSPAQGKDEKNLLPTFWGVNAEDSF
ncbi:hypothetical protein [Lonsdalea populi]|uniref:hypothetical protein n=1 Tax=Lonsdalea populi TaxID=1172565 RepID=UPI000A245F7E|nr:hypothetical protein [Lonsdalea populi]OSM94692.1 hypothetical protein AU508_13330 [Lonsdalea populi]RAT72013.1 hypothetical protein AU504_04125 [Lonsdalea populi]RAT75783.1 hypothetical protein AU506_08160 [Lonsdalea populi]RAT79546.1 hypothetical protein AU507_03130 [Lonsdalea populi]